MSDTNLSCVLHDKFDIRMEEQPVPEPKVGEVQLAIHSVGICGSDVSYYVKGRIGDFIVNSPMVLGHESSGVVTKLGEGVTSLKVGDRVAIEPGVPCRQCEFCKGGKYNLCPDVIFCATPPVHGTLTRRYCQAADFCFKMPDNVSFEEGAMLEPLSVGVHACKRAQVTIGQNILICGAGPIGLVSMLAAHSMGASKICITDISESRLEFAKTMGADITLNAMGVDPLKMAEKVKAELGCAPDVTIECSGAESCMSLGIYATKSGGKLVLVGLGAPMVTIPIVLAACREVDILGIFRYCNDYQDALNLVASGKINIKPMVTHRFKLEDSISAYETARTGEGNPVKIMIDCYKPE